MEYQEFLASKAIKAKPRGLTKIPELAPHLFDFQRECVSHHLQVGAGACFLNTGLGKTEVALDFMQKAIEATNTWALDLTPLAVAGQTKRRADKWGYEARVIRDQSEAGPGINICNYERIDKLDLDAFGIINLDEASILKSFVGKTTQKLIASFRHYRFKLVATATPAPNDHMELGNYADFLEVMAANEMLSRFFINDTSTASQEWRLKGHAVQAFWDWVSSWARMGEKPSDITGNVADDAAFELPPMEVIRHRAKDSRIDRELQDLFGAPNMSATNIHEVKRQTIEARAEMAASIINSDTWILWTDTNYEADAVRAAIPSVTEIRGSMHPDQKEEILEAFALGQIRHLLTKPSLTGFGCDWSHCSNMAFIGRSYSYEEWFQAVRRCWRFGQTKPVKVHLIVAEGETEIGRVLDRKSGDHIKMKNAMREAMRRATGKSEITKVAYVPTFTGSLPSWI